MSGSLAAWTKPTKVQEFIIQFSRQNSKKKIQVTAQAHFFQTSTPERSTKLKKPKNNFPINNNSDKNYVNNDGNNSNDENTLNNEETRWLNINTKDSAHTCGQ